MDTCHSTVCSCEPSSCVWEHAVSIRLRQHTRENDRAEVLLDGLLHRRLHSVSLEHGLLSPERGNAGCICCNLYTSGVCDVDEAFEILLAVHGPTRARSDNLLHLQCGNRDQS